jgi:putative ABC transport system substrate-binding protein
MRIFRASREGEFEVAFTTMVQQRRAALLVASDVFFLSHRDQLASLAALHRIPAIYYLREFVEVGGLMAYGNRLPDAPGDLPVQQSTKFELVINLKTAKALGIEIPILMQLLADEVIE